MLQTCARCAALTVRSVPHRQTTSRLARAASSAVAAPHHASRGSSVQGEQQATALKKKAGTYTSNVKTQLRQDRSSIIRHVTPDGQAISFSTSEKYDIDSLRKALWDHRLLGRGDGNDAMNLMGEAIWIPRWPVEDGSSSAAPPSISSSHASTTDVTKSPSGTNPTSGEIFVFETGSFVSWHMSMADAQAFADNVLKKNDIPVEIEPYAEPQMEAMGFVVQAGERTGVKEDMVVIGTPSEGEDTQVPQRQHSGSPPLATAIEPLPLIKKGPLTSIADLEGQAPHAAHASSSSALPKQTILPRSEDDLRARLSLSSGLARSTKLAVYEEMLDAHMEEVSYIPNALSSGDERPLKKKDILKNTGNLLRIRQHIYLQEENLIDPPEMFWSNAPLEIWFKEMARALDIDLRMRNLKTKVDYSLELQNTLSELNSTKVSHRLEIIIIALIACEIALVIMREGLPSFGRHPPTPEEKPSKVV